MKKKRIKGVLKPKPTIPNFSKKRKRKTKNFLSIVVTSDFHNSKDMIKKIPKGDVLIHCGDMCSGRDTIRDGIKKGKIPISIKNFNKLIGSLPHKVKICIAGNHDYLSSFSAEYIQKNILYNWIYLENSEHVLDVEKVFGDKKCKGENKIKFYGSPYTTIRHMCYSGDDKSLRDNWSKIPDDTDVLLTHCPPMDVLDLGLASVRSRVLGKCKICNKRHVTQMHFGCNELKKRVFEMGKMENSKLKFHCFGHCHEHGGKKLDLNGVTFVNGARRPVKVFIPLKNGKM